ncbi:hypothetical protein HDV05_002063 [Chytridiales sp. JEL 0842]|nr:hypothetical protein HDV05_002063 [Chytridiales sp. JEL 0842]
MLGKMDEPPSDGLSTEVVELSAFGAHLELLLPALMDTSLLSVKAMLLKHDTQESLQKFASDPQLNVLYVMQLSESLKGEDGSDASPQYELCAQLEYTYTPSQVGCVALIKRGPVLEKSRSLHHQLQLINLPGARDGTNVYEFLHLYLHNAISPFFDAFVAARSNQIGTTAPGRDDKEAKAGVPMAKKKIAELELSLLQLQQNVEIPEINLFIHPIVQRAVDESKAGSYRLTVDSVGPIVNDSSFLNKLQADVNGWIKEIQKVTKLSRDPSSGTASQEINFWLSMERALSQIEDQLKSDQIVLTLDILKHAKRFHATVSFLADTGLKEAIEKVQKYNQLMRDFPLNELLAATDVDKINEAIIMIFAHLNKKLKLSPYPIRRALPLVGSISKDLNEQLLKVLGNRRLMYLSYEEFERATSGCEEAFRIWDEQIKEFTNVAREVTRKRSEKILPIKIHHAHTKLQERISFIRNFRLQHEQLYNTIIRVMKTDKGIGLTDAGAVDDVNLAYDSVKNIDVLDVSPDGTEAWTAAESRYNDRVSRVENQIIASLRDRLGTARNANEMFRVFSKFNALFVRPKIRGAIQEYQTQLIDSVKEDIKKLHDKFKLHYRNSEAYHMSQLRDVPPISGAILWARQIERQLGLYMKRVEDVLGRGWELYSEGQKLQNESTSFRKKLDTKPIFDSWLGEITRRDLSVSGRIFDITRNRTLGNSLQLGVNFDSQIILLFKEVRNLLWQGYQVPHTVANIAKDAKRVYPFAVSLNETVRTYTQAIARVKRYEAIQPLIAVYHKDVQAHISKGIQLRWDYFVNTYDARPMATAGSHSENHRENRHVVFVRTFASIISNFHDKVNGAITIYEEINLAIEELKTCVYAKEKFQFCLDNIQKSIDSLNLGSYSNLESWTKELNGRVETILLGRLQNASKLWVSEIAATTSDTAALAEDSNKAATKNVVTDSAAEGRVPFIQVSVHELCLRNQIMHLDPPLDSARNGWYKQLHVWLSEVCDLHCIHSTTYEMGLPVLGATERSLNYRHLLTKLPSNVLSAAYDALENKLKCVSDYIQIWFRYQSLWDLDIDIILSKLGDDLHSWQNLVLEIKKSRTTFDNSEKKKSFGCLVVDYEQVQAKVNAKYDHWQKEVLNKFGLKLGAAMKEFFHIVSKARTDLERQSLDSSSTAEALTFITFVQDIRKKIPLWTNDVDVFRHSQKVLERQRYQFPSDWLFMDNVEGEWGAFQDIYARKNSTIEQQLAGIQLKIRAEDKVIERKIAEIIQQWSTEKPIQGNLKPDAALSSLSIYEQRMVKAKDEYELLRKAKEALDLENGSDYQLEVYLDELRDLKSVWKAVSQVWDSISVVRETLWSSTTPRKIRQQLDQLLSGMREMSTKIRQYPAFEYTQETVKAFMKLNSMLQDLKSEALRERHWRLLFKVLQLDSKTSFGELSIGHLWDADLKAKEAGLKEIITMAQGEMALEEFLKHVKEHWSAFSVELVNYQNKCRLIKGWDELFQKCAEHLNSLSAMKNSPYYKVFEEDALFWEDKLNRIHLLFDIWIDVQRQWVYLEGIFSGSADIKELLPVETARFQNINTDYLTLLKKVYKSPLILDILNVAGIMKSLERLAELLAKIQKALGEYLERERSAFPRFYFVGDEDLLEIIGNSKDVLRIQKHFPKMFAGISTIILSEDELSISAMVSREGETVRLKTPVSLQKHPKINEWLTQLELEMKVSLSLTLGDAISALQIFYEADAFDYSLFIKWIDGFPAQLVILSIQVLWTQLVERSLAKGGAPENMFEVPLRITERTLNQLADMVLDEVTPILRKKCEHLITELVHQRDVIRELRSRGVNSIRDFSWLYHMRYYFSGDPTQPLKSLTLKMADADFYYGFEYLGVSDRLVQTPLTDRCYLTLTQALKNRMGGSPFGPAGTGKTESVKALGSQLGRFVLVFCCDENFDFQAMGRIFIGLCRVGAWGCFDEFNRLEERILSAVSQQIQTIQIGLKKNCEIELVNKSVKVHEDTGIFITMNPGYAGRSNLPDNLKKLFRSIAMTHPDRELIAQVMLYSQGFRTAEMISSKVVPLFNLCNEQLSSQNHYDFGLRALKSVLVSAGNIKRNRLNVLRYSKQDDDQKLQKSTVDNAEVISDSLVEQEIVIQSIRETIAPKLVSDDIPLLQSLLTDVFPGVAPNNVEIDQLRCAIKDVAVSQRLVPGDLWVEKVLQLYNIQNIHHGLMMVGPSGSGKSSAWRTLLKALEKIDKIEGVSYVIDPKAVSKDGLYGYMDSTTREWTDGLFTHILRKIIDNVRGESLRRHWIVFDGDVDPEWVENLNSVLDDNRLLTLPNGERLALPKNVRIMFEVETLKYATLATVSRCGMVWFSEDIVTVPMLLSSYLNTLQAVNLEETDDIHQNNQEDSPTMLIQRQIAGIIMPYLQENGLVARTLKYVMAFEHVMDFTPIRALSTLFTLLNKTCRNVLDYNSNHIDFPMSAEHLENYVTRKLLLSVIWSFAGDVKLDGRIKLGEFLRTASSIGMPHDGSSLIDFDVDLASGDWSPWQGKVPTIEIEVHNVAAADVVVPTVDTVRHEDVLYSWLSEHRPIILCGPPGSGKESDGTTVEDLVRLWAHEALRLFQDRLVEPHERTWTDTNIDEIARKYFPTANLEGALERPILFSNWLSKSYTSVPRENLREFIKARLRVFYEEELDVPLVLFNDVLDHTTLSRFVAWMNGLSVVQVKVHNKYTADDFDDDLRSILRRAGCKGEKICFIMDESNVLDSGFLERMNTLLANAEVPGLFEGDDLSSLMSQCREAAQREGLMFDSSEELYRWFTHQVMKNLHVIFTMNPPENGFASRAATSPALFNRCVMDWFGNWSDQAFFQVGKEFTDTLDFDNQTYKPPPDFPLAYRDLPLPPSYRLAIVNAFVYVHFSLDQLNAKIMKRSIRKNYTTPRHFLDFINQYVKLFHEKKEELEEQQRHLNVGLDKLRDTVVKVEELRKSLALKKTELEAKTEQANEKLKKMVADQQEAEQQKSESLRVQEDIARQNVMIEERRKIVMADLANAEPAVIEAQNSVSNIKKQHLTEVRAMGNPPEAVKMAMESVCTLLGHKIESWKSVQAVIRRDDFIASIVNYDTNKMSKRIAEEMQNTYLSNPNFNFEAVNRASKACGPLVQWVKAQVGYAQILERVGPLRQEVAELEKSAEQTKKRASDIDNLIKSLEERISNYKEEYAVLISESQALKSEMDRVKARVERSLALLSNLSSENERWRMSSDSFDAQMSTIVGDVLLSAAYLSYGGYYDQFHRNEILAKWKAHLQEAGINFKSELSISEYLSTADDRLLWQEYSLPADELCTENAIMLKRFNRYPLIIDPSGQASTFLNNMHNKRKLTVTSFLDDSFLKVLESALRFGNALLVQNVENIDPILNAVLNRELRRTGGRTLIRLGSQEIDFSPTFTLYLSTRDPSVDFPPDICSRVTFVNFTVTRGSLQSQCLHQVLKAERPDTEKRRRDLVQLRGEFQLRLRHLEKSLLQALNESKGNILDDDNVMETLERLKREAAEVTSKVEETDTIMEEVDAVSASYTPLAQTCSAIFFALEQLSQLHHFYQFSLDFFMNIFDSILHKNPSLTGIKDYSARLKVLYNDLFTLSYRRVSRALLHDDQIVFGIMLAQIKMSKFSGELWDDEFDLLLNSAVSYQSDTTIPANVTQLYGDVGKQVQHLSKLPAFKDIFTDMISNASQWQSFLADSTPELCFPSICQKTHDLRDTQGLLKGLLLIKSVRPDRIIPAASLLIESVFGSSALMATESQLEDIVYKEITCQTPVAICSIPGYDASDRIEKLASEMNARLTMVAMGSSEGYSLADAAISSAMKAGSWVLLKNVHLAPSWLNQLEKKIHSLKAHSDFRLFLAMETNPKVPINILRLSLILMFEPAPGLKANIKESLAGLNQSLKNGPVERLRLYFLLAWLHAIIQERLRYAPIGWTKSYEFNDADYVMSLDIIDHWVGIVSQGRSNISPDRIPWEAIRILIMDDAADRAGLSAPESSKYESMVDWVTKLPEQQPPSWLGLPNNAEKLLMSSKGKLMLSNVVRLNSSLSEQVFGEGENDDLQSSGAGLGWRKHISKVINDWLKILPKSLKLGTALQMGEPLTRFFEREMQIGKSLLEDVLHDLNDLKQVCDNQLKQTNHLRSLISSLLKGELPKHWRKYTVPQVMSLSEWVCDFNRRLEQLQSLASSSSPLQLPIWLGGLFSPEAYITAFRQAVAQKKQLSLEQLHLRALPVAPAVMDDAVPVHGIRLYGAKWTNQGLAISSDTFSEVKMYLTWGTSDESSAPKQHLKIPVYLNEDRKDNLFIAHIENQASNAETSCKIVQHAVSFIAFSVM